MDAAATIAAAGWKVLMPELGDDDAARIVEALREQQQHSAVGGRLAQKSAYVPRRLCMGMR